MVASAIRSIFEQLDEASARAQLRRVADGLRPRLAKVAELLERAEDDQLAHCTFPSAHRRQIRSTNPQERLNKEIRRRTDVVGIFPTRRSLLRLVGMLLAEQDDEWAVGRNYFSAESMDLIDNPPSTEEVPARATHRELNRCRRDDDQPPLLHHVLGLDPGRREEDPVDGPELWPAARPLEHPELMPGERGSRGPWIRRLGHVGHC